MIALLAGLLAISGAAVSPQPVEVLGEVRVHGNHTTPDADVLAIAGLRVGDAVSDPILRDAQRRLEQSGRFANVEVRKRFRSIDDPSDIVAIILVEEVAGISEDDLIPGPLTRLRSRGMWLPVVDYADGYGFTYGARITFVGALGERSRISVPLTWGGERRAAVLADRTFARGPVSRVEGAASISRRVNPHFDIADTRRELRARAERALTPWLRAGGGARLTHVRFGSADGTYAVPAVDVTVDTRTDPGFPRNAVHLTLAAEQLRFDGGRRVPRWSADARGYVGLWRATVLAVRATAIRAGGALPPYEQALLGGTSTLRGYRLGYRAGDNLAAASAELRVPLTSPVLMSRFGVKAFLDGGTVYSHGARLEDQVFDRGAGGGVFMSWTVVRLGLDAAWPIGAGTRTPRWHFGLGVTF